mmetsp:Transcript_7789/g.17585  ORF Transcript_7789/g.17585 Transcript_7789/m.17585 type:complete len:442 (+) Transcript_7789:65-1390(+)
MYLYFLWKRIFYLQLSANTLLHSRHSPTRIIVHIILILLTSTSTIGHELRQQLCFKVRLLVPQSLLAKPSLGIQRRRRPASSTGNCLTINTIGNITAGEYSWDGRARASSLIQNVSRMFRVKFYQTLQKRSGGSVTNGNKYGIGIHFRFDSRVHILQHGSAHDFGHGCIQIDIVTIGCVFSIGCLPKNFSENGIPSDVNGRVFQHALCQNFGCTKRISSMDHGNRLTRPCQDQCILHCCIPTPNNQNMFPTIHVSITRGTTANATSPHFILSRHIQPIAFCPSSYNHHMRFNNARICHDLQRTTRRINSHHCLRLKRRSIFNGLLAHQRNNRGTSNIEQSRVILHIDSLALQLSSHGRGHHDWSQSGACSVNGSAQTGGSSANDCDAFGEWGWGPRMFEFGIVVVLFFDLGIELGIESFFNLGHELFLRCHVKIWLIGFST